MKHVALSLLLATSVYVLAADYTNVIVSTDWSKPIALQDGESHDHAIRGRLLIVEGYEPAYGGPRTEMHAMTFIELQNVTGACCGSIEVCFDVMNLNCELSEVSGKPVPKPTGGFGSGRGPIRPCWVTLPYNSTIRLFVNTGSRDPLAVYPNGEPRRHWSISQSDTNAYYLSGTLFLFTRTNAALARFPEAVQKSFYDQHGKGTLILPKTKISAGKSAKQN